MLTRYKKYIFCFAALEHLIKRVELLRFGQLGDVSRVNEKRRWRRHRINAIERNLERLRHIFVCLFAEADVTIANLEKAKVRSRRQRASCLRDFSKGSRRKHPAAYGPKQPRAGPCHALEKAAAIDSVVFVIVRNVIWHNLAPKLVGKISFHLFLPSRRDFIPRNYPHRSERRHFSAIPSLRLLLFEEVELSVSPVCLLPVDSRNRLGTGH